MHWQLSKPVSLWCIDRREQRFGTSKCSMAFQMPLMFIIFLGASDFGPHFGVRKARWLFSATLGADVRFWLTWRRWRHVSNPTLAEIRTLQASKHVSSSQLGSRQEYAQPHFATVISCWKVQVLAWFDLEFLRVPAGMSVALMHCMFFPQVANSRNVSQLRYRWKLQVTLEHLPQFPLRQKCTELYKSTENLRSFSAESFSPVGLKITDIYFSPSRYHKPLATS